MLDAKVQRSVRFRVGNQMIPSTPIRYARQIAALPWRTTPAGEVEFLLVTSRISRNWLIPKGWPMTGRTPAQAALQEALEEAGIKGKIASRPVGRYVYDKILKDGTVIPCSVKVFGMLVTEELDQWEEMHQRERHWFSQADAAQAVTEPDLGRFLAEVDITARKSAWTGVLA